MLVYRIFGLGPECACLCFSVPLIGHARGKRAYIHKGGHRVRFQARKYLLHLSENVVYVQIHCILSAVVSIDVTAILKVTRAKSSRLLLKVRKIKELCAAQQCICVYVYAEYGRQPGARTTPVVVERG